MFREEISEAHPYNNASNGDHCLEDFVDIFVLRVDSAAVLECSVLSLNYDGNASYFIYTFSNGVAVVALVHQGLEQRLALVEGGIRLKPS